MSCEKKIYPKLIKSDIKLTVGMLVSNHVEYIRKIMEALQPLLTAVPAELVIIDTKGEETDGAIAICREYTDKIYRFEWCNDFAAARNFCLEHAQGEWFLYQDDDEWFDSVQEFIDFFQSGECEQYFSGYYYTRDYHKDGSSSMAIAGRMIRRTETTRFIGKVHETFNPVFAPNKLFHCYTHHQGYVYSTPEQQKKHQDRNLTILWEEFKEQGYETRICSQIVQELLSLPETQQEGYRFATECIEVFNQQGNLLDSGVQWILVSLVRYFAVKKDYTGVVKQSREILGKYSLTQMARLALAAVVTVEAAKNQDVTAISEYAAVFVEQWDWLKVHEEDALLQTQMDFPHFYSEKYYHDVVGLGAIAANRAGDFILANKYWKRLPWQQQGFNGEKYTEELQKTVEGLNVLVTEEKKKYNKLQEEHETASEKEDFVRSDIKLTIGLLVSNRKEYIRRVLDALKPLLGAVPSELIIVDTKGADSDGSIEIAKEYTDKIYPFIWCDDFAAARNICLEHSRGEWFMYLDDDEVFEDVQEFIEFFNSGECDRYGAGYYQVKNYTVDGEASSAVVGRMVRRTKNTRFVGRVHEAFHVVHEPFKMFSAFVHHYGYVFHNEEERKLHQERNVTLLKRELEEHGVTPRTGAQLMQELLSRKETADGGFAFFETAIRELEKKNFLADSCTQWMLVASVRYYKIKQEYHELLNQASYIAEHYELSPIAQMALAGVVIEASAPLGNVQAILTYAPVYKEAWKWYLQHETEAIPQIQLDFTKYITRDYAVQVFQAAATCANAIKDYVMAYGYWEMLPWNDKSFDGNRYIKGMQETLTGLELSTK